MWGFIVKVWQFLFLIEKFRKNIINTFIILSLLLEMWKYSIRTNSENGRKIAVWFEKL